VFLGILTNGEANLVRLLCKGFKGKVDNLDFTKLEYGEIGFDELLGKLGLLRIDIIYNYSFNCNVVILLLLIILFLLVLILLLILIKIIFILYEVLFK
jgi:hypothetical protein